MGVYAESHTLLYANADLAKATQASEVLAFAEHWKTTSGRDPGLLIFDSKVTTQAQLAAHCLLTLCSIENVE